MQPRRHRCVVVVVDLEAVALPADRRVAAIPTAPSRVLLRPPRLLRLPHLAPLRVRKALRAHWPARRRPAAVVVVALLAVEPVADLALAEHPVLAQPQPTAPTRRSNSSSSWRPRAQTCTP